MDKISVVVPCYYEEKALPFFYKEICRISEEMKTSEFEFIFIDDGSEDKTLDIIKAFAQKDTRVKYLSFSRNFGKEAALYAGLKNATGEYVAIMDADLQDPPHLLMQMYDEIKKGEFDCIATRRKDRKGEPPIRSFFAKCFYKLINKVSKVNIVDGARDFRLMKRQMVEAILDVTEYNRFSKGIFGWVGFKTKWIEYQNVERVAGNTKWSFWKLLLYSIDAIVAFSTLPLVVATIAGSIFCMTSIILFLIIVIRALMLKSSITIWSSLVCIILFISGIQLFCIGILGEYISKTYLEVKNRPIYIVKEYSKGISNK